MINLYEILNTEFATLGCDKRHYKCKYKKVRNTIESPVKTHTFPLIIILVTFEWNLAMDDVC